MGRNQCDSPVRAASHPGTLLPAPVAIKPELADSAAKHSNDARRDSDPSTDTNTQPNSDWSFYNARKSSPDDNFKAAPPAPPAIPPTTKAQTAKSTPPTAIPAGSYTLQWRHMSAESA